jgi:DNA-binding IscR family transcriptional regulator
MAALEKQTGYAARELQRICSGLWQAMLIAPNPAGGWILSMPANRITLEHVFRCVVESPSPEEIGETVLVKPSAERPEVDAFIGQATITINQAVFQHLRRFTFSRLRFDGSTRVTFSPHFLRAPSYDAHSDSDLTDGDLPFPRLADFPPSDDNDKPDAAAPNRDFPTISPTPEP